MCKTILYVYVLPSEKAWAFQSLPVYLYTPPKLRDSP